jgi:hypothetical protein
MGPRSYKLKGQPSKLRKMQYEKVCIYHLSYTLLGLSFFLAENEA